MPVSLSDVRLAFYLRNKRNWLDRLIATVVLFCLEQDWLRYKVVPTPYGTPYMLRVYLSPGGTQKNPHRLAALFLQYIFEPDYDRGLHNHPYSWFLSTPLTAGYVEVRKKRHGPMKLRFIRPGRFNWTTRKYFHRIIRLLGPGAWTLFLAGPRLKAEPGWGFLEGDKYRDEKPDTSEGIAGDWSTWRAGA